MRRFMFALALGLGTILFSGTSFAGDKVHSAEWQKIDDAGRKNLQECLNDKSKSIKFCVKETKHMMKREMKKVEHSSK